MINFVGFSAEKYLSSLFIRVRIKIHFPLESPVTYSFILLKLLFKLVVVVVA